MRDTDTKGSVLGRDGWQSGIGAGVAWTGESSVDKRKSVMMPMFVISVSYEGA